MPFGLGFFLFFVVVGRGGGGGGDKVDNGFGTLFFDNRICCFKIVPQKYFVFNHLG